MDHYCGDLWAMNSTILFGNRRSCFVYPSCTLDCSRLASAMLGLFGGLSGKLTGLLFLTRVGRFSSASSGRQFMTSTQAKYETNDPRNLGGSWKSPADVVDPGTGYGKKARPVAIATWEFGKVAVEAAKDTLNNHGTALDALESGINAVELDTKDQYFVGLGGLPNADGVIEMDAAVMDGNSISYGAVMALRGIATPFSAARLVMERSPHNILAGQGAETFALENGMERVETLTEDAREQFLEWRRQLEQRGEVVGDRRLDESHDTIGMICLDEYGNLAAGTSTSGWPFKHPGRVGDAPVAGAGLYCDDRAGGAVATGDGEDILRTCLSFLVVENMRAGDSPSLACKKGIQRLKDVVARDRESSRIKATNEAIGDGPKMHERLTVAVMAVNPAGQIGAASTLGPNNIHRDRPSFPIAIWKEGDETRVLLEDDDELQDN